jgi:hypothetical protein
MLFLLLLCIIVLVVCSFLATTSTTGFVTTTRALFAMLRHVAHGGIPVLRLGCFLWISSLSLFMVDIREEIYDTTRSFAFQIFKSLKFETGTGRRGQHHTFNSWGFKHDAVVLFPVLCWVYRKRNVHPTKKVEYTDIYLRKLYR